MPVKIRLMRIGAKKRPFYRVVAVDERKKRTGGYLDLLGTYNPLTEPKEIKLDQNKIDAWLKKGAVPSDGYLRIIGKAPQRPPRKPKKDKGAGQTAPANEAQPVEKNTPALDTAPKGEEEPTLEQANKEPASESKEEESKPEGEAKE